MHTFSNLGVHPKLRRNHLCLLAQQSDSTYQSTCFELVVVADHIRARVCVVVVRISAQQCRREEHKESPMCCVEFDGERHKIASVSVDEPHALSPHSSTQAFSGKSTEQSVFADFFAGKKRRYSAAGAIGSPQLHIVFPIPRALAAIYCGSAEYGYYVIPVRSPEMASCCGLVDPFILPGFRPDPPPTHFIYYHTRKPRRRYKIVLIHKYRKHVVFDQNESWTTASNVLAAAQCHLVSSFFLRRWGHADRLDILCLSP